MAAWTLADVRAVAPEFRDAPDEAIDRAIEQAALFVAPDVLKARSKYAGALLTAHLLTLFPAEGVTPGAATPGPVASQSVGGVSVSYAIPPMSGGELGASFTESKYGRLYSQILRLSAGGPWVF